MTSDDSRGERIELLIWSKNGRRYESYLYSLGTAKTPLKTRIVIYVASDNCRGERAKRFYCGRRMEGVKYPITSF